MAKNLSMAGMTSWLLLALLLPALHLSEAQVGVCYGRSGNNLPSAQDALRLVQSYGIGTIRIYEPDHERLQAAQSTGVKVILGDHNDQIRPWGNDPWFAYWWVNDNVVPYASSIKYIVIGNEVDPSFDPLAPLVGPAMVNVHDALKKFNLDWQIKVTTAIATNLLSVSWPPSSGQFGNLGFMDPILDFLTQTDSPLMANVYTYFGYVANPSLGLDYALSSGPVKFTDPGNGLQYSSLFDAQVDALHAAIARTGHSNANKRRRISHGEGGWPTNGGNSATLQNAATFYSNLIKRAKQGTPLVPGPTEITLFALFDENQKPGDEVERHFGIFNTDKSPKFPLNFNVLSLYDE